MRRRAREVANAPGEGHNADRHVQNVKYAGAFHAIFPSFFCVSDMLFYARYENLKSIAAVITNSRMQLMPTTRLRILRREVRSAVESSRS